MERSVVCWLWDGNRDYSPAHVNVLQRMFARHLGPHRFICVADDTAGFSPDVEVLPTPPAAAALGELRTPENPRFPSCYRRLWMFSDEARVLGDRVLLVDIDLVVTASVDHLFDASDDFVGWRPRMTWGNQSRVGGGIYLLSPGSHRHVYERFAGEPSIAEARAAGYRGSDQAWMSYQLAADAPTWPDDVGIYSIRDLQDGIDPLPEDACLVQFNGPTKPWHVIRPDLSPAVGRRQMRLRRQAECLSWVREHWW